MLRILAPVPLTSIAASSGQADSSARNGDIVFQVSRSDQSLAIQLATNFPYSHMGLVYLNDDKAYASEVIQPVKAASLREWVAQSERSHFANKRLRDADGVLTPDPFDEW